MSRDAACQRIQLVANGHVAVCQAAGAAKCLRRVHHLNGDARLLPQFSLNRTVTEAAGRALSIPNRAPLRPRTTRQVAAKRLRS
jgi:hypothetical protein